uniref:Uncharacterized protein n=1 Tax=Arundo donax TaxID=35708 RepID=A0A0A8YR89_ARUDO
MVNMSMKQEQARLNMPLD